MSAEKAVVRKGHDIKSDVELSLTTGLTEVGWLDGDD